MSLSRRIVLAGLPLVPKPVVRRVAARYVAGERLADAVRVTRELNAEGVMGTIDVLGEEISERSQALEAVDEYIRVFDEIERQGLDSNVSIKPTLLGLKIDEAFCLDNIEKIAEAAKAHGNFVRIDMEDRTTTAATLRIYRELHARHGNLGCVLQSYMRRTLDDISRLPAEGASVRLCKGIYIEPREHAWKGYETVRLNFVEALDKLFRRGVYVGIATHDEYLLCAAVALVDRYGLTPDRYEFQMLLGVEAAMRRILVSQGHRMRVYVPYGRQWYQYSTRRVRENPDIAWHAARSFLGLG